MNLRNAIISAVMVLLLGSNLYLVHHVRLFEDRVEEIESSVEENESLYCKKSSRRPTTLSPLLTRPRLQPTRQKRWLMKHSLTSTT
jgi:hypothetical protein